MRKLYIFRAEGYQRDGAAGVVSSGEENARMLLRKHLDLRGVTGEPILLVGEKKPQENLIYYWRLTQQFTVVDHAEAVMFCHYHEG